MKIPERAVQQLAREFVKEATRLRGLAVCACPCGEAIKPHAFKPGHDAKLRSYYADKIRKTLAAEPS
jgi:hypothetical protein